MTCIFSSRDRLIRAIWELQLDGVPQHEIRTFCGLSVDEYREARGEALVTFEPTRHDILRVKNHHLGA